MEKKEQVLILGLGNDILSDDGVGIYAARRALEILAVEPKREIDIHVKEASIAGFALLDLLEGFSKAVIIDAVLDSSREAGSISLSSLEEFTATAHLVMAHQIDLPTAMLLGKKLNLDIPKEVFVVGVVAGDVTNLAEQCTASVQAAIDPAARLAIELASKGAS